MLFKKEVVDFFLHNKKRDNYEDIHNQQNKPTQPDILTRNNLYKDYNEPKVVDGHIYYHIKI